MAIEKFTVRSEVLLDLGQRLFIIDKDNEHGGYNLIS